MIEIAVLFHSGYGHTARLAQHIQHGAASETGVHAHLMSVDDLDWDLLDRCQGIVFGSPTYMGSVSAPFKQFMDQTSQRWVQQSWRDKVAAGFTNSWGLSGDKLNTLIQLAVFASQHGMIWVGQTEINIEQQPDSLNRLGSSLGLMAQSDNASPDLTPPAGDLQTAFRFGQRIARLTKRLTMESHG